VLQALRLLKRDGLVSDAPGRGVVVTPLTPESLQWVYQLRSALDGLAASLAAHRVAIAETQETGTRTRAGASEAWAALVATGRQAIAAGDLSALIQADMAFHRAIYAAAGNPLIEASARPHWCHIRRAMGAVLGDREGVRRLRSSVWDEHEALADAIAQGDAPRAQHLAGDHGERAGQHLHQQLVRTLQSGGFHASQRRSA
jgi:DNA-binding GntR family transcriptional regulator